MNVAQYPTVRASHPRVYLVHISTVLPGYDEPMFVCVPTKISTRTFQDSTPWQSL